MVRKIKRQMSSQFVNVFAPPPILMAQYSGDISRMLEWIEGKKFREGIGNLIIDEDDKCLDNKEFVSLKKWIGKRISEYTETVLNSSHPIEIQQSWININQKGMNHRRHYHINSFLSGVFYLDSSSEYHSPLMFHNHDFDRNFFVEPVQDFDDDGNYKSKSYHLQEAAPFFPNTGDLLLFSSVMHHEVVTNQSDHNRISLSFNTFPQIPFGNKDGKSYVQ